MTPTIMRFTPSQVADFNQHGFVLRPNLLGKAAMRALDARQRDIEPDWETRDWPVGCNPKAGRFFLMGEMLLQLVEKPEIIAIARQLLACDDVHVGACALGDVAMGVEANETPWFQLGWHADGDPNVPVVSFRTALDRHGPTNAPLRILPGSHLRPRDEVQAEILQNESATGRLTPEQCFERHPNEIEILLDPASTLVWSSSTWHATGRKTSPGPRRAMSWNFYPPQGRKRDLNALKLVLGERWRGWSIERRKLWGLA